jgi:hypothetical protein
MWKNISACRKRVRSVNGAKKQDDRELDRDEDGNPREGVASSSRDPQ